MSTTHPEKPYLGVFTVLEVEDIYYEMPNELTAKLNAENPSIGMGTSWNSYMNRGLGATDRGPLDLFTLLITQIYPNTDFAIKLYEKSKIYNDENYVNTENFRVLLERFQEMDRTLISIGMEPKGRHNNLGAIRYWVEYHFFFSRLIECLLKSIENDLKLKMELTIDFEGQYSFIKGFLKSDNLSLEIKTRRKPGVGKYLLLRNKKIHYNLIEIENNHFVFESAGRKYSINLNDSLCEIKKMGSTTIDVNSIKTIDTRQNVIIDLIENYCLHFNKITDHLGFAFGWEKPPSNGFLNRAVEFYKDIGDFEKIGQLFSIAKSRPNTWNIAYLESIDEEINENDGDDE
jgi:hypothetical protein